MQVRIADLIFDKELYPRINVNWVTVVSYTDAMRAGEKFPPIEVVKRGLGWVVVDGWHRSNAAKAAHFEEIEAIEVDALSPQEQFMRAVETNLKHGRGLSPYEKACIAERLCSAEFNWDQSRAARFLHMTSASLGRMITKRAIPIANGFGFGKMHKAPLEHLVAEGAVSEAAERAQTTLAVLNQQHLFTQAVAVLESGIVDLSDTKVCALLVKLESWCQGNSVSFHAAEESN